MSGWATPIVVVAGLAAMLGAGVWLLSQTPGALVDEAPPVLGPTPAEDGEPVIVVVEEGDSADDVAERLADAGVVESARHFRTLASLMGVGDDLVAGEYEFVEGETALTAVRRISQGITSPLIVTVREGLRSEEIAELLDEREILPEDQFLRALRERYDASFFEELPTGIGLEGFLFPATYGLSREPSARAVVAQMVSAFDQRYREELLPRMEAADGRSLLDIVTLASIIEREAQVPDERPTIASVFVNRLEAGLPLQADPTVQYAVSLDPESVERFGYWKEELSTADLAIDSPYNTYESLGLPPGPIANPGLGSLIAALEPAETNFLFFVARPDGSHVFASTLEEHQRNVCEIDPTRPECP